MDFLKGIGVAIITPFKKSGEIDFGAYRSLIDFYVNNGINYLVVLGTTGESNSVNFEEKDKIFECVVKSNRGRLPLVAGFGGNNTQKIVNEFSNFDMKNFSAILSVCPYYNRPSQEGIYQHFSHIANATPLPLILYDVPSRTGVSISNQTIFKLLEKFENIVGIKDATGNISKGLELLKNSPKNFHVISGDDLTALELVLNGGSGVISVVAGAFPLEFSNIINLAKENKTQEAAQKFKKIKNIIELLFKEGNPAGIKALLSIMGYCKNILRLPLTPVNMNLYFEIKEKLKVFQENLL